MASFGLTLTIGKIDGHHSASGVVTFGKSDTLKPCPFCGGTNLEVWNTHTPAYTVSCECGASMKGPCMESGKIRSAKKCRELHADAVDEAIEQWNGRVN